MPVVAAKVSSSPPLSDDDDGLRFGDVVQQENILRRAACRVRDIA